ncbi:MAG: GNAT family N-acetyltransferase [Alphaproteobacteria bacterium]|nr:GNAT family N-acetyltransferase [Alphaproteobacteria bacterium]
MAAYDTVQLLPRDIAVDGLPETGATDLDRIGVRIAFTDSLKEVETVWRVLEAKGIDSPGQSYDFIRIWTETFDIPRQNQAYVAVEIAGRPLLVLGLERRRRHGVEILTPFAGSHVGVNAPLIDRDRMALLSDEDRRVIWSRIRSALGADILRFGRVLKSDLASLPGASALPSDCLFRTEFTSWQACDSQQRTRSRRKHDKQQGQKLSAMGDVTYEDIPGTSDASAAIDVLFADRAARFAEQGIRDPFAPPAVRAFYRTVFRERDTLRGHMQVLRLNGAIVAARYNLIAGNRMFCLISSKSPDRTLQPGSPGKQILVHVMQSIFEQGITSFDMGAGLTDEKRHWCNVELPLVEAMMPVTPKGRLYAALVGTIPTLKARIKGNEKLFALAKAFRARLAGAR